MYKRIPVPVLLVRPLDKKQAFVFVKERPLCEFHHGGMRYAKHRACLRYRHGRASSHSHSIRRGSKAPALVVLCRNFARDAALAAAQRIGGQFAAIERGRTVSRAVDKRAVRGVHFRFRRGCQDGHYVPGAAGMLQDRDGEASAREIDVAEKPGNKRIVVPEQDERGSARSRYCAAGGAPQLPPCGRRARVPEARCSGRRIILSLTLCAPAV